MRATRDVRAYLRDRRVCHEHAALLSCICVLLVLHRDLAAAAVTDRAAEDCGCELGWELRRLRWLRIQCRWCLHVGESRRERRREGCERYSGNTTDVRTGATGCAGHVRVELVTVAKNPSSTSRGASQHSGRACDTNESRARAPPGFGLWGNTERPDLSPMVCVRLSLESFAVVPVVSAPTVAPASPPTLPPTAVAEATTAEAPTARLAAREAPTEIKRVA